MFLFIYILIFIILLGLYLYTPSKKLKFTAGYGCNVSGDWNSSCDAPTTCNTSGTCGSITASCGTGGHGMNTSTLSFVNGNENVVNYNGNLIDNNCGSQDAMCGCWNCQQNSDPDDPDSCNEQCATAQNLDNDNCNCARVEACSSL